MSRAKLRIHLPLKALRLLRAAIAGARRGMRGMLRRLGRQPGHLLRVLGRLKTRSKARRQEKNTETELR
jgi:hypothetical protein